MAFKKCSYNLLNKECQTQPDPQLSLLNYIYIYPSPTARTPHTTQKIYRSPSIDFNYLAK